MELVISNMVEMFSDIEWIVSDMTAIVSAMLGMSQWRGENSQ